MKVKSDCNKEMKTKNADQVQERAVINIDTWNEKGIHEKEKNLIKWK